MIFESKQETIIINDSKMACEICVLKYTEQDV